MKNEELGQLSNGLLRFRREYLAGEGFEALSQLIVEAEALVGTTIPDDYETEALPNEQAPTVEQLLHELLATRILCSTCLAERHQTATTQGIPIDQLEPPNVAQLIVRDASGSSAGACMAHVQMNVGPAIPPPGRLPSGLYVPGQGG